MASCDKPTRIGGFRINASDNNNNNNNNNSNNNNNNNNADTPSRLLSTTSRMTGFGFDGGSNDALCGSPRTLTTSASASQQQQQQLSSSFGADLSCGTGDAFDGRVSVSPSTLEGGSGTASLSIGFNKTVTSSSLGSSHFVDSGGSKDVGAVSRASKGRAEAGKERENHNVINNRMSNVLPFGGGSSSTFRAGKVFFSVGTDSTRGCGTGSSYSGPSKFGTNTDITFRVNDSSYERGFGSGSNTSLGSSHRLNEMSNTQSETAVSICF